MHAQKHHPSNADGRAILPSVWLLVGAYNTTMWEITEVLKLENKD
jgi:hypothetical protein